ncbi:hypothetical protein Tco_0994786 [Tanacetum coccineum]
MCKLCCEASPPVKGDFNSIVTSLKALEESFSSCNHVRNFLRALPTKWHPKVKVIEESNDLSTLLLDELNTNLKVYEVALEKDSEVSKNSDDKEYAMVVRDFKKLFRRRGEFVRQLYDDKKNFRISNEKNRSEEDDNSKRDEICLMAHDTNEVLSDTLYYSISSLDSKSLQNEYDKLCKISLRIINKNKHLKTKNEILDNEVCDLKKRLERLERNKEISVEFESCIDLCTKIDLLSLKLTKFENSGHFLQEMIENQRLQKDKKGLGFTEDRA